MKEEKVLVTANTPGIHFSLGDYFHPLLDGSEGWKDEVIRNSKMVDRWLAEQDNTILQLIPYVLCITKDGKILSYQRKGGGEGRLEGKHSVGIGGHVNTEDLPENKNIPTWHTVLAGAVREVTEELEIEEEYVRFNLREIGTVYVPSDDGGDKVGPGPNVGEVHLGIVYMLPIDEAVTIRDNEGMIKPKFVSTKTTLSKYEQWSQKILEQLNDILPELLNGKDSTD